MEDDRRLCQALVESDVGLLILDADLRVVLASAAAKDIFSNISPLTQGELFTAGMSPANRNLHTSRCQKAALGRPVVAELSVGPAGALNCYQLTYSVLKSDNSTRGWLLQAVDIGDEKQRMQDLLGQAQKNRELLGLAADYSYELAFDPDGQPQVVWISEDFSRLTGLKSVPRDLAGWLELIAPEDHPAIFERLRQFQQGGVQSIEYRLIGRSGRYLWLEDVAEIQMDPGTHQPIRALGVARRIDRQKAAQQALRESEARYRLLAESASDLISRHDDFGRFLYASGAARTILGISPESLLGRPLLSLVHPDDIARVEAALAQAQSQPQRIIYRIQNNAQYLWVESGLHQLQPNDKGLVGITREVSERIRAQEKQQQLEAHLLHVQRLESLGSLAGGVAHNFNNLLLSILSNLEMVLLDPDVKTESQDALKDAFEAAQRASELTRQMLIYVGQARINLEPLGLGPLIEEMLPLLAVPARGCQLDLLLEPHLPPVRADKGQIQQVVLNLVTNAAEAMANKPGRIEIRLRQVELNATELTRYLTKGQLSAGHYASLEIRDSGEGIRPELLARIFDPFVTTKFMGRGLGLASVLGIISSHHGGVRVDSDLGVGTRLEVLLPFVGN